MAQRRVDDNGSLEASPLEEDLIEASHTGWAAFAMAP